MKGFHKKTARVTERSKSREETTKESSGIGRGTYILDKSGGLAL